LISVQPTVVAQRQITVVQSEDIRKLRGGVWTETHGYLYIDRDATGGQPWDCSQRYGREWEDRKGASLFHPLVINCLAKACGRSWRRNSNATDERATNDNDRRCDYPKGLQLYSGIVSTKPEPNTNVNLGKCLQHALRMAKRRKILWMNSKENKLLYGWAPVPATALPTYAYVLVSPRGLMILVNC
jgi:hypothetical protein